MVITRDGEPVAELRPLPPAPLTVRELIRRRRSLTPVDPQQLRDDIDAVLDPTL